MTNKSDEQTIAARPVLILVAAGASSRMGGIKKEYLPMQSGTVLSSAARVFLETLPFSVVAVTYPAAQTPADNAAHKNACRAALFADPFVAKNATASAEDGSVLVGNVSARTQFLFVAGGATRQQSVLNALEAVANAVSHTAPVQADGNASASGGNDCAPANPLVFVHDGARPFVSAQIIRDCAAAAEQYGAAVPALQPVDTQKETDENGFITRHLVRANLAAVQTPQVFRLQPLLAAHRTAAAKNSSCTDDTEIWDTFAADGKTLHRTKIVAGASENKKITYPADIPQTENQSHTAAQNTTQEQIMTIRTGLGYDKHVLVSGRKLLLGGVEIPFEKGEDGHSDGDVLLHAITDALLGAAALGDIGSYFPPSAPQWKDADSKTLLSAVWKDVRAAGWHLGNLDCVLALEKPKFLPHRNDVRASIAAVLGVQTEQVFVKAKTGEKTGDVGTGKVVEAFATCLLTK